MDRLTAILRWIAGHGRETLVIWTLAALSIWSFVEIADFALEGDSPSIEERILLAMRTQADANDPVGPAWVEELARDVTSLGGTGLIVLMTFASAGFLFLQRKPYLAGYLLASVGTGTAASFILKAAFDRARPALVAHGQEVYTSSFPSGHSMMATLAFFTIAALLASAIESRTLKAYVLSLAMFMALAVGATRVYLGVHWPSDVLAGWAAGAAWALVCWGLVFRLRLARR